MELGQRSSHIEGVVMAFRNEKHPMVLVHADRELGFLDNENEVRIPTREYEALTALESHTRRLAAKRTPIRRDNLAFLLERIRTART